MSYPDCTRDMAMHSILFQHLFDKTILQKRQTNGPISSRTRSRTSPRSTQTRPNSTTTASGAITNRCSVGRALQRLARKRGQLRRHLETSPECRDEDGELKHKFHDRILQLTTTSHPAPYPRGWDSEERMRQRIYPHLYRTPLDEMERMWNDEELEEEFGILPGEQKEGNEAMDGDFLIEMEVKDGLRQERRCLSFMEEGVAADGVWRQLEVRREDEEMWWREVQRERVVAEWRVMDSRCVGIVRSVRQGL